MEIRTEFSSRRQSSRDGIYPNYIILISSDQHLSARALVKSMVYSSRVRSVHYVVGKEVYSLVPVKRAAWSIAPCFYNGFEIDNKNTISVCFTPSVLKDGTTTIHPLVLENLNALCEHLCRAYSIPKTNIIKASELNLGLSSHPL